MKRASEFVCLAERYEIEEGSAQSTVIRRMDLKTDGSAPLRVENLAPGIARFMYASLSRKMELPRAKRINVIFIRR